MKQTIGLFKNYLALYKILQGIETALEKSIIYGYNPKDLNLKTIIQNNNYQNVSGMKENVEKLTNDWIGGMKIMY